MAEKTTKKKPEENEVKEEKKEPKAEVKAEAKEEKKLSLKEQVRGTIKSLKTRAIYVVKVSGAPDHIHEDELNKKPEKIDQLLTRIEGQGGWVKVVRFWHD